MVSRQRCAPCVEQERPIKGTCPLSFLCWPPRMDGRGQIQGSSANEVDLLMHTTHIPASLDQVERFRDVLGSRHGLPGEMVIVPQLERLAKWDWR